MPIHKFFAVLIRLFAIFLFLRSIVGFQLLIKVIIEGSYHGMEINLLNMFIYSGIPVIISLFLWQFPLIVSKAIIKPELESNIKLESAFNILPALFIALASYFLFYGASDLIYYSFYMLIEDDSMVLDADYKANMWTSFIQFVVSIVMLVNHKKIALFFIGNKSESK